MREYAAVVMKRPKGVTVIGYIFLTYAFSAAYTLAFSRWAPFDAHSPKEVAIAVVTLLITVTLGVALLRMQSWSRWLGIVVGAIVLTGPKVMAAHGLAQKISVGFAVLFLVWVISYLSRPDVKASFRRAVPGQDSNPVDQTPST